MSTTVGSGAVKIYFSDAFGISPEALAEHGAFDVSLVNDLPLFIDPFLLFNSEKRAYHALHDNIIKYLCFLRDKSAAGQVDRGLLEAWFTFREVKQTWLGYSRAGNRGSGLGMKFATALNANLSRVFADFGAEKITRGSHLEKLCLIEDGVGRDNISDFATNLIKDYLLEYTQSFARTYLRRSQRRNVPVRKARFNYSTQSWETRTYELPYTAGDYVILTPLDMLTKDEIWINRVDLVREYPNVAASIPNSQLQAQLNNYFVQRLGEIQKEDEEKRRKTLDAAESRRKRRRRRQREATQSQQDRAAQDTIAAFPALIDHYIRWKEDRGDEAEAIAEARVRASERLYLRQVRDVVAKLLQATPFYSIAGNTLDEARQRVMHLKDVIENKGGHKLFYVDGEPIRRETDLHILYRLTWFGTPSDVNPEVDGGRGPADFAISRGRADKSLVEFKLASNSALARNLEHQTPIYERASDAQASLKVVVYFSRAERQKIDGILDRLGLIGDPNIILIDARDDNKPSGSKAGRGADL